MSEIRKEDYEEPRCVICDPVTGQAVDSMSRIPVQRVVEKLDEYCGREDFAGAERHLKYWLAEAQSIRDMRGEFTLCEEMMGFYRKQGREEEAVASAKDALRLMEFLGYGDAPSGATCFVNCGTVYDAFGMPETAIGYFERARKIMEKQPFPDYSKLGGLYNNMGLTLVDLERWDEEEACYRRALECMAEVKHGELEQAITWLNMADAAAYEKGFEEAEETAHEYLSKAKELLETPDLPRNGYYAFVLEKCAPAFYCWGDAEYGETIEERSRKIYEENRRAER